MAKSQQLAIPDLGIQIVEDTTLTRLETMKSFFQFVGFWQVEAILDPRGQSSREETKFPRVATRTQDAHCQPLLFSSFDGSHTHHILREGRQKVREEKHVKARRGMPPRRGRRVRE